MLRKITTLLKRRAQLRTNEAGSVSIIAGMTFMALIMGVFALAFDIGKANLDQSDLEAELTALNRIASLEFSYWQVRHEAKACDRTGLILGPTMADLSREEAQQAALDTLQAWADQRIRNSEGLEKARVVDVQLNQNTKGQWLLDFFAKVPIPSVFNMKAGEKTCTLNATPEKGCTFVQSGTVLPFNPTTPPAAGQEFVGDPNVPQNMAVYFVQPIDTISAANIDSGDLNTVINAARDVIRALGIIIPGPLVSGLTRGAAVVQDQPDGGCIEDDRAGLSGGSYDNAAGFDGGNTSPNVNCDQTRKWPIYGEFYAAHVRRCDADPVWTRVVRPRTECHRDYSGIGTRNNFEELVDCTNYCASDHPGGACNGDLSRETCGCGCTSYCAEPASCDQTNCTIDAGSCGGTMRDCDGDGFSDDCEETENVTDEALCGCADTDYRASWNIKITETVYEVEFFHSCPESVASEAATYKSPTEFVSFFARYVGPDRSNINTTPNYWGVNDIPGSVSQGSMGFPQQTTELFPLTFENTENAWLWACDNTPTTTRGPSGCSWGAVDCLIPGGPVPTVDRYTVTFKPETCVNLTDSGCNYPIGVYQIFMNFFGLQGPRFADGDVPDDPKLALEGNENCADCDRTVQCPIANQYSYTNVPSGTGGSIPNVRYINRVSSRDTMPIPAEHLLISSFSLETRRPNGSPVGSYLDTFDWGSGKQGTLGQSTFDEPGFGACPNVRFPDEIKPNPVGGVWGMQEAEAGLLDVNVVSTPRNPVPIGIHMIDVSGWADVVATYDAGGDPFPQAAPLVLDLATIFEEGTTKPVEGVGLGENNLEAVLSNIQSKGSDGGGDVWANGHGPGGMCATLKAGARKALGAGKDFTSLIYVGSCPSGLGWADPSLSYKGEAVNWFASSNVPGGGKPGDLQTAAPLLKTMNSSRDVDLQAATLSCFQQVASSVDAFYVFTDASCSRVAELATSYTNGESTVGGTGGCILDDPDAEACHAGDCAAELIWAIMDKRNPEVRKGGLDPARD